MLSKLTPCLWFDQEAEEAANYYVGIFPNSRITAVSRYPAGNPHGRPAGLALMVAFELEGHSFTALNGGPHYKFTEAVSFQIECADQAELDRYWELLSAGGPPDCQECGWLKDRFGLSWQVCFAGLGELLSKADAEKMGRFFQVIGGTKKLEIAAIKRALEG